MPCFAARCRSVLYAIGIVLTLSGCARYWSEPREAAMSDADRQTPLTCVSHGALVLAHDRHDEDGETAVPLPEADTSRICAA